MKESTVLLMLLAPLSVLSHPKRQTRDVTDDAMCAGVANFVRLPAGDCTRYYQCYSGQAYSMQCPEDTWFNEDEQICDDQAPPEGCVLAPGEQPPHEQPEPDYLPDQTEDDADDAAVPVPEEPEDEEPEETQDQEDDIDVIPEEEDEQEVIPIVPDDGVELEPFPEEIVTDDIPEECNDESSDENCTYSGSGDDAFLIIPENEIGVDVEPILGEDGFGF